MNNAKYIGLDVHQAPLSAVVLDSRGKLAMESISKRKTQRSCSLFMGYAEACTSPFKKGTCAAWLRILLQPNVARVDVCEKCPVKIRQQEQIGSMPPGWPIFCEAGCFRRSTTVSKSWRELFGDHAGSHAGDDLAESAVAKLGYSLCW